MKQVEIYTKGYCPYCSRAKELLRIKQIPFTEYDITEDPAREWEMHRRAGKQTVPEIFIGGTLVGGCAELFDLDERGELDSRLELRPGCCG